MKKIFTLSTGLFLFANIFGQQSTLIVNNYSTYDFHTALLAATDNTPCYPAVSIGFDGNATNPSQVIVPANSSDLNGNQLVYESYKDSGMPTFNGLYPIGSYLVSTTGTNQQIRVPSHFSLNPAGGISLGTNWRYAKFFMTYAGTNTSVSGGSPLTYFNGTVGDGTPCSAGSSYVSTTFGDAEMFSITSGGVAYTYIQIYP
jgi:hypothetical protein